MIQRRQNGFGYGCCLTRVASSTSSKYQKRFINIPFVNRNHNELPVGRMLKIFRVHFSRPKGISTNLRRAKQVGRENLHINKSGLCLMARESADSIAGNPKPRCIHTIAHPKRHAYTPSQSQSDTTTSGRQRPEQHLVGHCNQRPHARRRAGRYMSVTTSALHRHEQSTHLSSSSHSRGRSMKRCSQSPSGSFAMAFSFCFPFPRVTVCSGTRVAV